MDSSASRPAISNGLPPSDALNECDDQLAGTRDRGNLPTLLARELAFPRDVGRAQPGLGQHQHDMLNTANRRLALAPPIFTTLQIGEIAVEGEPLGLEQRSA